MPSVELIIAAFLGLMMVASVLSLKARIPYTIVLVFIGMGVTTFGLAGHGVPALLEDVKSSIFDQFNGQQGSALFVGLIVPPLLFEAMIRTRSSDLVSVARPSVVLATIGVAIATLVGGFVLWRFALLPPTTSFLFAAAIAPTDAATVLEVFRRAKVPSKLATLMETEAAFNDATGIVIFSVVLGSIVGVKGSLVQTLGSFAIVFGGGVLVGLAISFIAELLTSLVSEKHTETILTISAVYGSYALASAFGVSGLIAVSITGLYFGNLTLRSAMSPATRESVALFWEIAAFLANSVAFLYIGFSTNILDFVGRFSTIVYAILAVTAARIASVYPILTLFDRLSDKIPMKWRNVATLGGMRGALSIALVASIPAATAVDAPTIRTLVLGVAFISISMQATFLFRYIRKSFPEEQAGKAELLSVRLARALDAIESLQKLKEEGMLDDEEFVLQLERDKDELRDVLEDISSTAGTTEILKSRASGLYSTIVTLPMSKAMQILRLNRMEKPIQSVIERATSRGKDKESDKEKKAT